MKSNKISIHYFHILWRPIVTVENMYFETFVISKWNKNPRYSTQYCAVTELSQQSTWPSQHTILWTCLGTNRTSLGLLAATCFTICNINLSWSAQWICDDVEINLDYIYADVYIYMICSKYHWRYFKLLMYMEKYVGINDVICVMTIVIM